MFAAHIGKHTTPGRYVGESYGGGIVAYLYVSGDPGYVVGEQHGIIARSADITDRAWSNITSAAVGETSVNLGAGTANTNLIIAQSGHTSSAASWSRASGSTVFTDFALPSLYDLIRLYSNRLSIGGFEGGTYWTSSEVSATTAIAVNFNFGTTPTTPKGTSCQLRPVRYF